MKKSKLKMRLEKAAAAWGVAYDVARFAGTESAWSDERDAMAKWDALILAWRRRIGKR